MSPKRLFLFTVLGSVVLIAIGTRIVQAQVSANETKLTFNSFLTENTQRTFIVTGNPLPKLKITSHDLRDAQSGSVLLSSQIAITSVRDEAANKETFTATISGVTKPGHYIGELDVNGDANNKLLTIQLDVTLRALAAVEADVNSKSISLKVRQPVLDIPYVGETAASGQPPYVRDIYLIQPALEQATVRGASVLGMKGTNDVLLPSGVVTVTQQFPLNIPGGSTVTLKVAAGGDNVQAGEYNGTLQVWVVDQKNPIQIPVKLLVKDGPVIAFLLLVFGLVTAGLFGWWAAKGKGVKELITSLEKLAGKITSKQKLQAAERMEATRLVRETMESVEAGEAAAEIKKKHDAAEAYIASSMAQVDKFVAEVLAPLELTTENIKPGAAIRGNFLTALTEIRTNIIAGNYPSFAATAKLVSDPQTGLSRKVTYFESLAKKYNDATADKKEELYKKMDQATTTLELIQALVAAGVQVTPDPGMSFATQADSATFAAPPLIELSLKRQWLLSVSAAAVAIIAFVFVLGVGWISIYMRSDIFGANPMDYVTIFLWGATAEALRGQTITLTGLKTIAQERPAS